MDQSKDTYKLVYLFYTYSRHTDWHRQTEIEIQGISRLLWCMKRAQDTILSNVKKKPSFNLIDNSYSQFMLKSQLLFLKTWSERYSFLKLMSPDIFGPGDEPRAGVWLKLFQPRRCHLSTWTGSKNIYHRSTRFIHWRVYFKVCRHSIHRLVTVWKWFVTLI